MSVSEELNEELQCIFNFICIYCVKVINYILEEKPCKSLNLVWC